VTIEQQFAGIERAIITETMWAANEAGKDAFGEARLNSSGGKSAAEIAANDHEYASRHPARDDDFIINSQTGAFKRDWQRTPAYYSGGEVRTSILNHNPVSDYFGGTVFMRRRPIEDAVAQFLENRALVVLEVAAREIEFQFS
jgi:hypothetical protein